MTPTFTIDARDAEGAVEITVTYPDFAIIDAGFDEPFRQRLVSSYEKHTQSPLNRDCILSITAKVAGSQVVKGIFELYKVVRARSGYLICANYPHNYVRALTDLGLPSLPGFVLCSSTSEARKKLLELRTQPEV